MASNAEFETLLSMEAVEEIARLEIKKIGKRVTAFQIKCSADVVKHLAVAGYSPENGARFLRRTIERQLLGPVTRAVASGQTAGAHSVDVRLEDSKLRFYAVGSAALGGSRG